MADDAMPASYRYSKSDAHELIARVPVMFKILEATMSATMDRRKFYSRKLVIDSNFSNIQQGTTMELK